MMPSFRKALFLYNPVAGRAQSATARLLERAAEVFRAAAVEVTLEPTRNKGEAGRQAQEAIARGFDAIMACGGDGTVYDVLQGLVHAPEHVALGILPLGTANVLAHDLGLKDDVVAAARALLGYVPRRIAVGQLRWCDPVLGGEQIRFFSVAAGVGVHAQLIYNASARHKRRGGFSVYYLAGFKLLFLHEFIPFRARITLLDGSVRSEEVLEVVAMRVSSFGKWLRRWRPGGALDRDHLQVITLKPSSRWAMFSYVLSALFRGTEADVQSRSARIEFVRAAHVRCEPLDNGPSRIRAQADGEVLGGMPFEISIIPHALTLLMPPVSR